MKTQISRNSFKAEKRYSGVYQQQGRMITDDDWNNLVDVLKGHLAEALKDVVGTGSPRSGEVTGAVTIDTTNRSIVPGDLYVDGLRASLPGTIEDRIPMHDQPDFPGAPTLPDPGPEYVVYADVWERPLTSLEDPDLRDVGLNGADTCTRTQTMLQVKICPHDVDPEKDIPQHGDAPLTLTLHSEQESGDPCDPCAGQVGTTEGRIGNYLFRLEVHSAEWTGGNLTGLILKWSSENGAEQYEAQIEDQMPPGFVVSGRCTYEFFDLNSEKHLGVHLNQDPDFQPSLGELKQTYVIPNEEPYVRRWDGYCKLAYDGSNWSLVEGFDMGIDLSAAGRVFLDTSMNVTSLKVNLEELRMELVLDGSKFVAGDYWLAPVREAEHGPGSRVLPGDTAEDRDPPEEAGAPPEGIVHHYLRLAQVAADGTVQLYDDNADERRKSFPPLTNLQAYDVGYLRDPTDCTNGLFDTTHDNVEKALNRLCKLAAEHIDYQADCSQGLFKGFEGTVKQALDRVCTIQAEDVRFSKPCDTGFYQGHTVTTVADALELLCQVQTGGGGCKVTVGPGGQFATLAGAIQSLLGQNNVDICLCLLPGTHSFGGKWINEVDRLHLAITGCGASTKVILESPLQFIGLNSLRLENFTMDSTKQESPLIVEGCSEVDISNLHRVGLANTDPLIRVVGGEWVRLSENILEAYTESDSKEEMGLIKPQKVFAFATELAELYTMPFRDDFFGPAGERADVWAKLRQNERLKIAGDIQSSLEELLKRSENLQFTPSEELSYRRLIEVLASQGVDAQALLAGLFEVRDQALHTVAGIGVLFMDALASVIMADNTIFGSVGLYGLPGADDLSRGQVDELSGRFRPPSPVRFLSSGASLQARDNRITRLTVSADLVDTLGALIIDPDEKGLVQGLYRTALFESNIISGAGNQLLFENLTLSANDFQSLVQIRIGWAVGKTAIISGNRVQSAQYADLRDEVFTLGGGAMQTAAGESAKAANLPQGNW
jgi:hypothetical protein